MSDRSNPAAAGSQRLAVLSELTADPVLTAGASLVLAALLLLAFGVAGSWHWKAAVWTAAVFSVAAFALVAFAASRHTQRATVAGEAPRSGGQRPPREGQTPAAAGRRLPRTQPGDAAQDEAEIASTVGSAPAEPPPRPRFAGFGKPRTAPAPPVATPPPPLTNVAVMRVQGSNVRVAARPASASRPEPPAVRPPSGPPITPPMVQVGLPREPGFPTYQPVDPEAPVIQVLNRYHRAQCRYVSVAAADQAVHTTLGAARASNAMPCGVCRP